MVPTLSVLVALPEVLLDRLPRWLSQSYRLRWPGHWSRMFSAVEASYSFSEPASVRTQVPT